MSECISPASEALEAALKKLSETKKEIVSEQKRLAKGRIKDFSFTAWDGSKILLSTLFGKKDDLIVIHNMGVHCAYCTMWADGFNGIYPHLSDRAAFVVLSNDPPETQKAFAAKRGWRFPMYSAKDSHFFEDIGFTSDDFPHMGKYAPGISTYHRDNGVMSHVASADFGPGDPFCPTFPIFDLLQGGMGDWTAKFSY